jgi:tRNA pseudouridine55 synthase
MLHGFLNIDKPAGMTSHDVVARLRRLVGQKRVGHGGTLDPAATGVLPVGLGEATRLLEYLVDGRKRYHARVRLGVVTTTDDAEGTVVSEQPVPELEPSAVTDLLGNFTGRVEQIPPMYSAIQVEGRRLYDLARQGQHLDLAPRTVEINQITLLDLDLPLMTLDVICGKGTYIRALARDIGNAIGCGAHLRELRRVEVGPLNLQSATSLQTLTEDPALLSQALLPPEAAVEHLPRFDVDEQTAQRIRNGLPVERSDGSTEQLARAHVDGTLLGLLRYDGVVWRPFKVFSWR